MDTNSTELDKFMEAFEFKWQEKKTSPPKSFSKTYLSSSFAVISKENYLDFIL